MHNLPWEYGSKEPLICPDLVGSKEGEEVGSQPHARKEETVHESEHHTMDWRKLFAVSLDQTMKYFPL